MSASTARGRGPVPGNWGRFGDDDELGTVNFLTPDRVLVGARCVRTGQRYPLIIPADQPSSPGGSPSFKPDGQAFRRTSFRRNESRNGLIVNDDHVAFSTQGSSQWDSFAHTGVIEDGVDGVFYNGVGLDAVDEDGRARRNGIDAVARVGIAGRGVLIDVARMVAGGAAEPLPVTYRVTPEETEACLKHQGVVVEPGDIVCFRTGWTEAFLAADDAGRTALLEPVHQPDGGVLWNVPGITPDHAEMAHRHEWAAVTADNTGVEALPLPPGAASAHARMLRNLGLLFGELLIFGDLAEACSADGRWDFFFVAVPMWIPGGMGSPANAIAIR